MSVRAVASNLLAPGGCCVRISKTVRANSQRLRGFSRWVGIACLAAFLLFGSFTMSSADEGGVSFWLPGSYGSLAAVPSEAGFSLSVIYNHSAVGSRGGRTLQYGDRFVAGLDARTDLVALVPTYTFETPFLGGQAAIGAMLTGVSGRADASAEFTEPHGAAWSRGGGDTVNAFGDIFPQASLKWNLENHNLMVYVTGNIPVGYYDKSKLANAGIGHGAVDAGGGYTDLNPESGWEFSFVLGCTYNFKNYHTQYQNGVDAHLDLGASYFLTKQLHLGPVGYYYQQLSGDSGSGAKLGDFKSRVAGIGPQLGYFFSVGDTQGYVNVKAYKEFASRNRPADWNAWLSLSFFFSGE